MYEKKQRNLRAISFSNLIIFGAFLSFFGAHFSGGSNYTLVPKMLERSPVNFNSRRISDSGKTAKR